MNGCQFAALTNIAPPATISRTTPTLITTMTEFTVADSWTPTINSAVTAMVMRTAGRLNTAVAVPPPASDTTVPGAALSAAGNCQPNSASSALRLPDHPTA